jgi:hypothetical protein
MLRKKARVPFALVSLAAFAPSALAGEVGAYAVTSFGTCANALSNTDKDAIGFRDSRPADLAINYLWTNEDAYQSDWTTNDYYASSGTTTGFDGADASMLTYLSSHGNSSGGTFFGSLGQSQGCSFNNGAMSLGNAKNRYLFLSVCYGLMLGDGKLLPEHQAHSVEDLQVVWPKGLAGTRCIFSYGTVSTDSPDYGRFFWEKWNHVGVTNAKAFLDASWAISTRQQPVVMCFGANEAEANAKMAETVFDYGASNYGYNVWTWYDPVAPARPAPKSAHVTAAAPRRVQLAKTTLETGLAAFPLTQKSGAATRKAYATSRGGSEAAAATIAPSVAATSKGWRYVNPKRTPITATKAARVLTDAEVIGKASALLEELRLGSTKGKDAAGASGLAVAYVRHQNAASTDDPTPRVVGKTVAFEQAVAGGMPMLTDAGKILVSYDMNGDVTEIEDTRVAATAAKAVPEATDALRETTTPESAEADLMALAERRFPGAEIKAGAVEIGYVEVEGGAAELVARLPVTTSEGEFAKAQFVVLPIE